jgi:hypothetical protein
VVRVGNFGASAGANRISPCRQRMAKGAMRFFTYASDAQQSCGGGGFYFLVDPYVSLKLMKSRAKIKINTLCLFPRFKIWATLKMEK